MAWPGGRAAARPDAEGDTGRSGRCCGCCCTVTNTTMVTDPYMYAEPNHLSLIRTLS